MSECVCHVSERMGARHSSAAHRQGPHHSPGCPLWFDPTRIPAHAQQQIDNAQTEAEYKQAILDEDTMREHCE